MNKVILFVFGLYLITESVNASFENDVKGINNKVTSGYDNKIAEDCENVKIDGIENIVESSKYTNILGSKNIVESSKNTEIEGESNKIAEDCENVKIIGLYNIAKSSKNSEIKGNNNEVSGDKINIEGLKNIVRASKYTKIYGSKNIVESSKNTEIEGEDNKVSGDKINIFGSENTVSGNGNYVSGFNNIVKEDGVLLLGRRLNVAAKGIIETLAFDSVLDNGSPEDAVNEVNQIIRKEFNQKHISHDERKLKKLHKKAKGFMVLDICPNGIHGGDKCHSCLLLWREPKNTIIFEQTNDSISGITVKYSMQFVCIKNENQIAQVKIGNNVIYRRVN